MTDVNIFVAFAAGVFSFLSPCVLPLIPSYLSFVSGVSLDEMRSEEARARVRWRVILNSAAFIIGFSLVFISLGASASFLGGLFLDYRNTIRILGGLFILLVGLYLVGLFKIAVLDRYLQFNLKDKPAGYLGSILVGITFAVAWTPCVGPILGATLALASTAGEVGRGTLLLTSYAAGLALPFFLSALALLTGLATQGCSGDFHAGQPFDDSLGFGCGHLADRQRRYLLETRRLRAFLGQSQ